MATSVATSVGISTGISVATSVGGMRISVDWGLTLDFWGFSALGAGGGAVGKGMRFSSPALGSSSVVLRPKCWRKYSVVQ